jgi:hypothetical protein
MLVNQFVDLRRMVTLEWWVGKVTVTLPRYLVLARRLRAWPSRRAIGREGHCRERVKLWIGQTVVRTKKPNTIT